MVLSFGSWNLLDFTLFRSMYALANFRRIVPVYITAIWQLVVPPKFNILWFISHNKLLTRDKLVKRQHLDDVPSLFYCEAESCAYTCFLTM